VYKHIKRGGGSHRGRGRSFSQWAVILRGGEILGQTTQSVIKGKTVRIKRAQEVTLGKRGGGEKKGDQSLSADK